MIRPVTTLTLLFIAATVAAGEPPKQTAPPAERLAAILKEYKDAESTLRKEAQAARNDPTAEAKLEKLLKEYESKLANTFSDVLDIARQDPKSATALEALEFLLTQPQTYYKPVGLAAMQLVAEHHAANPKVGKIIAWVGYYTPHATGNPKEHAAAMALIKAVAEKNPDRTARGQAVVALARQAKQKFAYAEYKQSKDVDQLAAETEKAFELVVKDYADCRRLISEKAGTLRDEAKRELYELRHLRVGKVASEIEGEDLDGVKFKLSDYRGKVVVLDFWGDW